MITSSVKSRQPPREPWTLERLDHEINISMGAAIDESSAHSYGSALNSYIEFCRLHKLPIEPTPRTLARYIVFMSHHISPNSVDSYVSGIINQLEPTFPGVRSIRTSPLVSRTIRGCKRLRGKQINRKAPLARHHLRKTIDTLPANPSHDDLLFLGLLLPGFHALMRLGELTMPDNPKIRNPRKCPKRPSVTIHDNRYEFWLPAHKADKTFEGNHIIITDLDALEWFMRYLHARDTSHPLNPFLWLRSSGNPPTRSWFIRRLRKIIPDTRFAGQSLRAGGATALAEGVPLHIIQAAGRWASDTFHIYIRKHPILRIAFIHTQH